MIFLRLALLTVITLVCAFPAQAREISPLRNFMWGATPEDVRKFETATFYKKEGDSEFYVEAFKDSYRTIRYDFRDGKLWRGRYSYDALYHPDPMNVMRQVADFQLALEQIYGKPTADELVWKRNRYRNDSKWLTAAIRSGDVTVRTTWMLPQTKVVMEAYNNVRVYELGYTAEKYEPPRDMDQSRAILNLPNTEETKP